MVCQCRGTWKGIKNKVGGDLNISLQALFTYFYVLVIALIPRNFSSNPNNFEHKNYNKHSLKLESWSSQELKELSSKHFHLETWYFQKLKKTSFPHLKNLQHFEEISSTPLTHLALLSLESCKLKAFPQKDSPFLCCTSKTLDYFLF